MTRMAARTPGIGTTFWACKKREQRFSLAHLDGLPGLWRRSTHLGARRPSHAAIRRLNAFARQRNERHRTRSHGCTIRRAGLRLGIEQSR